MSDLTRRLAHAYGTRIAHARFDLAGALEEVLGGVGLTATDAGGRVEWSGADPVLKSPLRLGGAATIAILAKSVAAAALHRWRGGLGQDISIDLRPTPHRLCPFYDGKWELLGRHPAVPSLEVGNIMGATFFRTRDDRWVLPQALYPNLRLRAQQLLGVPLTYEPVAEAIGRWEARALEEAGAQAGIVMPMVRTLPEFLAEPHYRETLADMPLIEVTRIGEGAREPLRPLGAQPFSGYRALGMGHVIAGAGFGRSLALHGADVLNLWRPGEGELEPIYASANVGMRSTWLFARHERKLLEELLQGADIFFQNRRLPHLRELGLLPEDLARLRPGIVYVSISLHGMTGPWAERPGFDQSAGCVTGVMSLQGSDDQPALPPIGVVNDYLGAWLAQVGTVAALRRRAEEGGSYHVHVSLTRAALWLLSLGIFDKGWAERVADSSDEHRYRDPEVFRAITAMGDYQGVTDQVRMSLTPGSYDPVLIPRGASRPEWLTR
ncbi:MAG: carnitine dehydratase [Pseudomonas sp.]|uniref:CoA transferase n=1 Tax=Pseudomonas sp. TaxID=306 RepID=UPI00122931B5|nr:CoA transferase [Pseudomonas sp.]RZI76945.1 MAG: carnitine dehydratase [Pseudomonas sp.]